MTRMGTPRRQAKKTGLALLAALVLALAALPGAAHATGTLDQQQTEVDAFLQLCGFPCQDQDLQVSLAQTFTAGLSGELDQVDLYLDRFPSTSGPLTVEIRDTSGGTPGASVLARASLPASAVPTSAEFVAVAFASPVSLLAGSQYAIVAYATNSLYAFGLFNFSDYAGGAEFISLASPPTTWSEVCCVNDGRAPDLAFKTYVTVAPVAPTSKSQCKKGGWRSYSQFKNQGQCVSFVVHRT